MVGIKIPTYILVPQSAHQMTSIAAHAAAVESGAMIQIFAFVSAIEAVSIIAVTDMMNGSDRVPGDYGFDPLQLSKGKSQEAKDKMTLKELENGRLAMLAFSGIVTQAVLTGQGFPYV